MWANDVGTGKVFVQIPFDNVFEDVEFGWLIIKNELKSRLHFVSSSNHGIIVKHEFEEKCIYVKISLLLKLGLRRPP